MFMFIKIPGSQACNVEFKSALSSKLGCPGRYRSMRHCEDLHGTSFQLTDTFLLRVKRRDFF